MRDVSQREAIGFLVDLDQCVRLPDGGMRDGFWEWAERVAADGLDISIYSVRARLSDGRHDIMDWLASEALSVGFHEIVVATEPEALALLVRRHHGPLLRLMLVAQRADVFIGPRAIRFSGNWRELGQNIAA